MRKTVVAILFVLTLALAVVFYVVDRGLTLIVITNVGADAVDVTLTSDRDETGKIERIEPGSWSTFHYVAHGDAGLNLACSVGGTTTTIPVGYVANGMPQYAAIALSDCQQVGRTARRL